MDGDNLHTNFNMYILRKHESVVAAFAPKFHLKLMFFIHKRGWGKGRNL